MRLFTVILTDGRTWLTKAVSEERAMKQAEELFLDSKPSVCVQHTFNWSYHELDCSGGLYD